VNEPQGAARRFKEKGCRDVPEIRTLEKGVKEGDRKSGAFLGPEKQVRRKSIT